MGRFQDGIESFWKTLSSEDVKETQEDKFGGELGRAAQEQKVIEDSHKNLLSSFHNGEYRSKKGNYIDNNSNNINKNDERENPKNLDDNDRVI